jgi:hypothetical protein
VRTDEERPGGADAVARTCHPRAGSLGHALDREELGSAKLIAVELVITRGPGELPIRTTDRLQIRPIDEHGVRALPVATFPLERLAEVPNVLEVVAD